MKIAFVLPESEPFSPIRGGAFTLWVTQTLPFMREIEPVIIAPPDPEQYGGLQIKNITAHKRLEFLSRFLPKAGRKYFSMVYPLAVALYGKRQGFDAYLVFNRPLLCLAIRQLNPNARIVLRMGNDHLCQLSLRRLRQVLAATDHLVACSEHVARGIVARCPEERAVVSVIYNGVNSDQFRPAAPRQTDFSNPKPDQCPREVLFVGRLRQEKGVHCLLHAMRRVVDVVQNVELRVVGSSWFGHDERTPYVEQLCRISSDLQNRITFTGHIPHDRLPDCYTAADVFVCPSIWEEPLANVVLEAMAAGLPVVASNRGGIPEAVGEAGLLVDPENTDELAEAIVRVLRTPGLPAELGKLARARAKERFTWSRCADEFLSLVT